MQRYVGEPVKDVPECMREIAVPEIPADSGLDHDGSDVIAANDPEQLRIAGLVRRLAPDFGVSPRLALSVIRAESNFKAGAISEKNAQGLMQLIPETSARFNVKKPFDPEQNIRGGLAYLRWLLSYFRGDVALVAAAYNAGEGAVNRHRGIPPYAETRSYVRRILDWFKQGEHPYDPAVTEPSPELQRIHARRAM
jgi:soluble lytic murein transglycosylase-like protein